MSIERLLMKCILDGILSSIIGYILILIINLFIFKPIIIDYKTILTLFLPGFILPFIYYIFPISI